ncbi:MAG: ectoine hydrolase DoeA [Gammaproteobacteria bacterium]|nr:ectoine hydrolase DoeA [Gammaproteobacteria bacterium]
MPKDAKLNFTREEYASRLAKTRTAMSERNIDCLIVVDPSNMAWLTGYDGWSFYTHQCVIVQHEHEPIWWGRGLDAPGAVRTTYMHDDNIIKYLDHFVQSDTCHPMDDLSRVLTEMKLDKVTIGVEMENYYFSAAAYRALQAHLPNANLADATALVNWQRLIKSAQELSYMRSAARIVEGMHSHIYDIIRPGLAKNELAAEIFHSGIMGKDEHWGDYPAILPLLPTGMDATAAHLTWDNSKLKPGDITFFEIAGCHKRYHCPLSRTISLGKPPQKYLDAEKAVLNAMHTGLDSARPGKCCEDVAIAFFDTLEKHGFKKDNRTGYSIGLSYPPDWGERTISLRRGDKTELRPNMTFHFMPALWLDDGGLEITESVVITDSGYESLASVPQKLLVK